MSDEINHMMSNLEVYKHKTKIKLENIEDKYSKDKELSLFYSSKLDSVTNEWRSDNERLESLSNNILDIMASSSLIISRSGATTIFEIIGLNIPSILIPSPNVVNNHQYHNALYLHNKKASVLLEEKDLNIDSLNKNIEYCINNVVIKDNLKKIKDDYLKVSWEGVIENV
jgi:UDP-N-acetylglucosamine:LPS N-acetylglucosamine transferase